MAEPKYYLRFDLQGSSAFCELLELASNEALSRQEIVWPTDGLDELIQGTEFLEKMKQAAIQGLQQCIVSANAAPGKIQKLEINAANELFFFGIPKSDHNSASVVCSHDSFDEHLQQAVDTVKLQRQFRTSEWFYTPFHSWLAMVFSGTTKSLPSLMDCLHRSDFFDAETEKWFPNALKQLKVHADQLPEPVHAGIQVAKTRIGLITSVSVIPISFIYR